VTNQDHWNIYNEHKPSPQIFIDWAYYSMIGAALQRRVWCGDPKNPLFANLYVVLVGDPGLGKSEATKPVVDCIGHWKLDNKKSKETFFDQNEFNHVARKSNESATLIKMAPDSTTFEALCRNMSRSISAFHGVPVEEGKPTIPYLHSSMAFTLDELSSLLKKHAESVVDFMVRSYDGRSYSYESVGRGVDYVKNPCLSLLAGTTPDFLKRVFGTQDALLSGGLASRITFVYAERPRFRTAFPMPMKEHQLASEKVILDHIKKLTEVYGYVDFGEEAMKWFDDWWSKEEEKTRVNNHPKLKDYYARKNINVIKLATVLHFSESVSMVVENGIELLKRAIAIFAETEREMHRVLQFDHKNPISSLAKQILNYVKAHIDGVSKTDIVIEHFGEGDTKQIDEALSYLLHVEKKLRTVGNLYKINMV
jgi:hypothetical protein